MSHAGAYIARSGVIGPEQGGGKRLWLDEAAKVATGLRQLAMGRSHILKMMTTPMKKPIQTRRPRQIDLDAL